MRGWNYPDSLSTEIACVSDTKKTACHRKEAYLHMTARCKLNMRQYHIQIHSDEPQIQHQAHSQKICASLQRHFATMLPDFCPYHLQSMQLASPASRDSSGNRLVVGGYSVYRKTRSACALRRIDKGETGIATSYRGHVENSDA
jgi:hypothetical protein